MTITWHRLTRTKIKGRNRLKNDFRRAEERRVELRSQFPFCEELAYVVYGRDRSELDPDTGAHR